MADFSTPLEGFWAGKFGDEYIACNAGEAVVNSNLALFANILCFASGVRSILEIGCNIGLDLEAKRIDPEFQLTGYEINDKAAAIVREK